MDEIERLCARDGRVTSSSLAEALGVTRQAAHRRLRAAVARGELKPVGAGRARHYVQSVPLFRFAIGGADEDRIFARVEQRLESDLDLLGPDARETLAYAFTELVNNAIDHSLGSEVVVRLAILSGSFHLRIDDDGIGAFESVRRCRRGLDLIEAAAEVTKGKVTSMPERHTGEGLFFTSRAADFFWLRCNGLELHRDNEVDDVVIREHEDHVGTRVELAVYDPPRRKLMDVFRAHEVDSRFARTRTVVKLFGLGKSFVSRSEARRLLHGLDAFEEVVVDFRDVPGIGQGFADEMFRVWATRHPEVVLAPIHMAEPVRFFVDRALRARGNSGD